MAHVFIVGSGAVGTAAACLLTGMGHRVTFVAFHESGINALRAKGYDACLGNDIEREPGSFIFLASDDLASDDEPGRGPPPGDAAGIGLRDDTFATTSCSAVDAPCSAEPAR